MELTKDLLKAGRMIAQMQALHGLRCRYCIMDLEELLERDGFPNIAGEEVYFNYNATILPKLSADGYLLDFMSTGLVTTIQCVNTTKKIVEFWSFVP